MVGGRVDLWVVEWVGRGRFVSRGVFSCLREGALLLSFGTVLVFSAIPASSGEVRVRTNVSVCCCTCCCTAPAHGRCVGWRVNVLAGGEVCRVVRW